MAAAPTAVQLIGRKTLELMHRNHVPTALLPFEIMGIPTPAWIGLGSHVLLDGGQFAGPARRRVGGSAWAKVYYWVDPAEDLVGVSCRSSMTGVLLPDRDFGRWSTRPSSIDDAPIRAAESTEPAMGG